LIRAFFLRKQQLKVVVRAHWFAEQKPLYVGAIKSLQECELFFIQSRSKLVQ
jgi:hypothetical protein